MNMKHLSKLFVVVVLVSLMAACAPAPTPEVVVEKVVETVVVVETVEVEGETIVEEKVVEKEVEKLVTAVPLDEVTLRLNWSYYGIHAAFFYGKELGIYKDHGIALEIKQGNGSSNAMKLVANKDSDFGYGSNGALISNMTGDAPIIGVASIDAMGTDAVLCRPDSGITEFADLKGKEIMTTAGAGVNDYFPVALAFEGMTEEDVTMVFVAESALVSSYLENLAPCILAGIDDKPAQIEAEGGDPPVIFEYSNHGVAQPGYVIAAHQDMVADNPDLVQRFVDATLESVAACDEDRDACAMALVDYNSQLAESFETVRKQLDVSLDILYSPNNTDMVLGLNVPEDWANVLELKKQYQELETDMTSEDFYTNDFVLK